MLETMRNKEYGSDFSLVVNQSFLKQPTSESLFCAANCSLFFSGRVALYNLVQMGIEKLNWRKLYVPSFYCHEVIKFLEDLPINIHYYEFNPFLDLPDKSIDFEDDSSNAIVNVNFFGLNCLDLKDVKNCIKIDDFTHHLEGIDSSRADYCFGSLRKELPLPCGGFILSPTKRNVPESTYNSKAEEISVRKLAAMFLKKEYLSKKSENKDLYRELFIEAEHQFESNCTNAAMPLTSIAILKQLNIASILQRKKENIAYALSLLNHEMNLEFNLKRKDDNVFGLIIKCPNANVKSDLKSHLIQSNIYPAVLWPDQMTGRDQEISERILFVHLDYRYDFEDIELITTIINKFSPNE